MCRKHLLLLLLFVTAASAQEANERAASCVFEDGHAVTVRYTPATGKEQIPKGQVWGPGGAPMILFTDVPITVATHELAVGAYRTYVLNSNGTWTLILNKNVDPNAKYDSNSDIARIPLEAAQLPSPQAETTVVFGKTGPKQCAMRIYHAKLGIFGAEFNAK